jgi:hypothetical protein
MDLQYAAAYMRLAPQYRKRHKMPKALQNYRKGCQSSMKLCREYPARV